MAFVLIGNPATAGQSHKAHVNPGQMYVHTTTSTNVVVMFAKDGSVKSQLLIFGIENAEAFAQELLSAVREARSGGTKG
jgi:hypothetical protein